MTIGIECVSCVVCKLLKITTLKKCLKRFKRLKPCKKFSRIPRICISVHGVHVEVRHRPQPRHLPQEGDERARESNRTGQIQLCLK